MTSIATAIREIRALRYFKATPRLIRFNFEVNHSLSGKPQIRFCEEIKSPDDFAPGINPIIFVHGVDYACEREAAEDFLIPLAEAVKLPDSRKSSEYYLLSWNSLLFRKETRDSLGMCTRRRVIFFVGAFRLWGLFWRDAERRANDAACFLSGYVEKCVAAGSIPTAVTHSAGGLVWAKTVQNLLNQCTNSLQNPDDAGIPRIGRWWNLQPALPAKAFCPGGEFVQVAELYSGHRPVHLMCYSRVDFILGALYRFARKVPAMGQFGSSSCKVKQRDLTWMAFEAHGRNVLAGRMGHFFFRARNALRVDARSIGLV